MNPTEKTVRNFLIWLRDTPHCEGAWLPENPRTEKHQVTNYDGKVHTVHYPIYTHFRVSGMGRTKTVSTAVQEASREFVDVSPSVPDRMFFPNERGLKIAAGQEEGFLDA